MDVGDFLSNRILNGLPLGVWVAHVPSGELAYANGTFRKIMGMPALDAVVAGEYAEPYGIYTPEGLPYPESKMPYVRALEAEGPVVVDDIVIHRHDGGRVSIRAWAEPLRDQDGEMTHIVVAFSDITAEVKAQKAQRESEDRLHRSRRMESVGKLAGGIAHDFNNLLTAVYAIADSMRNQEVDAKRRGDFDKILSASERAVGLTRSLLGFAGRGKNLSQPVSLHETAESLAELLRRTLDPRIRLEVEFESELGVVLGDASQIEQILMNLILNARDALAERGTITVRTRDVEISGAEGKDWDLEKGHYVEVSVDDDGPGISEEIREQIFEPYFTTKTHGDLKGTGLGLATVYGIVDAHHGQVRVTESSTGGARFEVMLPVAARQRPAAKRHRASVPLKSALGTVLVIDDEELVRNAAAAALESLGYDALLVGSGKEALDLVRNASRTCSAILLDMVMPGMDGRETYIALKKVAPDIPVVLMSGFALNEEAQNILDLGVGAFLPKPFGLVELSERLASVQG